MTCQVNSCERRALPDWAVCGAHAASLISAAYGSTDYPLWARPRLQSLPLDRDALTRPEQVARAMDRTA